MGSITVFTNYIVANQVALIGALCAGYAFARFVTKLTVTKKDDAVVSSVGTFINKALALFGKKPAVEVEEVKEEIKTEQK